MALTLIVNGNQSNASDVNQIINILQQPAGGQEKGKYFLEFGAYASTAWMSAYINTKSQGTAPASVSVDSAVQAPVSCNAPATDFLDSFGFKVKSNSTAVTTDARVGGNFTVQY